MMKKNMYVVNCTLNGQTLQQPFLNINNLLYGATLEFWMSDTPSDTFWKKYKVPSWMSP